MDIQTLQITNLRDELAQKIINLETWIKNLEQADKQQSTGRVIRQQQIAARKAELLLTTEIKTSLDHILNHTPGEVSLPYIPSQHIVN